MLVALEEKDIVIGDTYRFITDFTDYKRFNNTDVTVMRELEDGEEIDKFETGAMYEVKANNGDTLHAFLNELFISEEVSIHGIAKWIESTGYQPKSTIEYLAERVLSYASDAYEHENYDIWIEDREPFDKEYIKSYIQRIGGLSELDIKQEIKPLSVGDLKKILDAYSDSTAIKFDYEVNNEYGGTFKIKENNIEFDIDKNELIILMED